MSLLISYYRSYGYGLPVVTLDGKGNRDFIVNGKMDIFQTRFLFILKSNN